MNKYLRIIALALAMLTLSGMLAACADTGDSNQTTDNSATTNAPAADTTAEETLYTPDDLAESYNFDETITIFMWSNYTMMEFYAEETGDVIDDAIYKRNNSVETRLGITFEYVEEKGASGQMDAWIQKAENDWQADNSYDIYAGYSRSAPAMALRGMTANLLDYDTFSVEKPWWPAALTNECTINDKLYFCSGDISTNLLWMMIGTFYSKELYSEYFADEKSPMDMVESNEWTMEKFFSMVEDIYTDDGSNTADKADFYGYVIYETNVDAYQTAAGIISIERDDDDGLKISEDWYSQRCADVCELLGNFLDSEGVYHDSSTSTRDIFFEQRSVFITDRVFIVAGKDTQETGKIEFSYGVVPQPKYSTDQESFMTNVGHPFTMYAVNSQSKKIEAAVTTLEAMGSANHRTVTPAVFESAMKVRYTDDPQAGRMFDILRNNISFDIGRLYASTFKNSTANLFRTTALSGNPSGLLSQIKKNEKVIQAGINTLMEYYDK